MKKLLIITIALFTLVACNNSQHYKVVVLFPNDSTDGQIAYLTNYDSDDTLAQGEIKNKNLVIEGEVERSYIARLIVGKKRNEFVVEGGEIAIKWPDGLATGTPTNEKLNALCDEKNKLDEKEDMEEYKAFFKKSYLENKDNALGPFFFAYYLLFDEYSVAQVDSMLNEMPAYYRDLKRIQKAINAAKAIEATAEGKQFTDFANAKGEKLSDHAGKGKYCLVDFWASWCAPCRKEIGNIKQLHAKYADKMNFVGIAVWDEEEATIKAMKELQVAWPVIMNGKNWKEPTNIYGVAGIPHIMLIDPNGKIVARGLNGDELINTVDALYATK